MLAWPGFLWLALSIYLLLAVVAGEVVRPLLRRLLERRDRRRAPAVAAVPHPERVPAGAPAQQRQEADGEAVNSPQESRRDGPASEEPAAAGPASRAPREPAAPSRRLFVSRAVAGAAAAAAVGTVGFGTYGVLRGPRVKRVTVPLAKLPRAGHGYRIAVVSDIHLSPVLGRGFAQKVVDTINSTRPDLIAVVGDLVDGSVKDLGPAAAPSPSWRPGTARTS